MVTRLPGTFGSAYEAISSTLSSADPSVLFAAQRGTRAVGIACVVSGNNLPARSAQASPAAIAIIIGRGSRAGPKDSVDAIGAMSSFSKSLPDRVTGLKMPRRRPALVAQEA